MRSLVIIERLRAYLRDKTVLKRTPLLVGPTGIAKSAIIKSLVKELNYNLIDVRTAFMSRLDIEGLSEKIEEENNLYSEICPMWQFMRCTDNYIEFMQKCAEYMATVEGEWARDLENNFREQAKIPVLFLDEITRCEPSVRQVLTKILTDKEFLGYPMTKVRVIAATNSQLDEDGNIVEMYATNQAYDVAFYDRFESIYVNAETMNSIWTKWAEKNLIGETYRKMKQSVPYDEHFLLSNDYQTIMTHPFANYRSWELESKFMEMASKINIPGDKARAFTGNITGGTVKIDNLKEFIGLAIDTRTPALIIGPSGIAKTSLVRQYAESYDAEMFSINLSEVDRLDVEGMPVKQKVVKCAVNGYKITKTALVEVQRILAECDLPEFVTVRAPRKDYKDKFEEAVKKNKEIIIHFDECNRVQNVQVMSVIFQVISDNRLFGVEFDPKNVTTILTCNLDENCADAQELDPALCARFAIFYQNNFNKNSVRGFKEFIKKNNFDLDIQEYLEGKTDEEILEIIGSVNDRTLEVSAASTRGWEDLSNTLKDSNIKYLKSKTLFGSLKARRDISEYNWINSNKNNILKYCSHIDKWDGALFMKEIQSPEYQIKEVERFQSEYLSGKYRVTDDIIRLLMKVDAKLREYKKEFFEIFLGSWAVDFVDFWNDKYSFDDTRVEVAELTEEELKKYVREAIESVNGGYVADVKACMLLLEIYKERSDKIRDVLLVYKEIRSTYIVDIKAVLDKLRMDCSEVFSILEDNVPELVAKDMGKIIVDELEWLGDIVDELECGNTQK